MSFDYTQEIYYHNLATGVISNFIGWLKWDFSQVALKKRQTTFGQGPVP